MSCLLCLFITSKNFEIDWPTFRHNSKLKKAKFYLVEDQNLQETPSFAKALKKIMINNLITNLITLTGIKQLFLF